MVTMIVGLMIFLVVAVATVSIGAALFLLVPFLIGKGANGVSNSLTNSNRLQLGCLGSIMVAFGGAIVGDILFGPVGPQVAHIHVVPAFIGAVIVMVLLDLFLRGSRSKQQ